MRTVHFVVSVTRTPFSLATALTPANAHKSAIAIVSIEAKRCRIVRRRQRQEQPIVIRELFCDATALKNERTNISKL